MAKKGPILIIEDDPADRALFRQAFREAHVFNQLLFFDDGDSAYQFIQLHTEEPFLIFCDVNLPRHDGIEFKKQLDQHTQIWARSIPFIFYTNYVSQYAVNEAYKQTTVQGFFQKDNSYTEFKDVIRTIIDYWRICRQPSLK